MLSKVIDLALELNRVDGADSDGPVYIYSNNTFIIHAFAGSVNVNCGSKRPGIYTRISDVVEWIEHIIS